MQIFKKTIIIVGSISFLIKAQENNPAYINTVFKNVMDSKTHSDFQYNFDFFFKSIDKNPNLQMPIKYWFWWVPSNITPLKMIIIKTSQLEFSPFESYLEVKKILDKNADPLFEPHHKPFFFYTNKVFNNDVFLLSVLYRNLGALAAILENIYNRKDFVQMIHKIPKSFIINLQSGKLKMLLITNNFSMPKISIKPRPQETAQIIELLDNLQQVTNNRMSLADTKTHLKKVIQSIVDRDIKSIIKSKEKYPISITDRATKINIQETQEAINNSNYRIFKNILDAKTKNEFEQNFNSFLNFTTRHPNDQMPIKILGTWYNTAITPLKLVVYKTSTLHFTIEDSEHFTQQILNTTANPQINPPSSLPTMYSLLFTEGSAIFNEDPITIALSYNNIGAFKALMDTVVNRQINLNIQNIANNVWTYDFRNKNAKNPSYYTTMRSLVRDYAFFIASRSFSPTVKASEHYKGTEAEKNASINVAIEEAKQREYS